MYRFQIEKFHWPLGSTDFACWIFWDNHQSQNQEALNKKRVLEKNIGLNLDFQWNYNQEEDDHKQFPSKEESQSLYNQHLKLLLQQQQNISSSRNKSGREQSATEYAKALSRTGTMKGAGGAGGDGEIVQVHGGHIIKATGRKDRHSKVFTAKGPRDRRVRLSANTAIQFYDVQDRLGCDRPSKAVDWLMKKAKNAIDKLSHESQETDEMDPCSQAQLQSHLRGNNSLVMASPAETQSIEESMKSFFPMSSSDNSLMNLQNYPHDIISRMGIQTGDLGLSLQTLQDQNLNHIANPVTFEANYAKTEEWNGGGEDEKRHNNVGYIFNPNSMPQQLFYSQNSSAFSQREPLQSNYSNFVSSWNQRQFPSVYHQNAQPNHQSSLYGIHFGSNFQIPARIHGEDEPRMLSIHPSPSVPPSSQQL